MPVQSPQSQLLAAVVVLSLPLGAFAASPPTGAQALRLAPVQKDVEYDRPTADETAQCTIKPEKAAGKTGWVVRTASGQVLRNFVDTNGDNVVDQWSYFKDGVEVYRDIDSNFNGKADQGRWLHTAGTRWGIDANEDGKFEGWKMISAEEVSAEVVAALRDNDAARFSRLLLSPRELKALGLGPARMEEVKKKLIAAPAAFAEYAASQKVVTPESAWVYFGGGKPGLLPQGSEESTADIMVYENVAAMIDTAGKGGQLPVGTIVRVEDAWRLIDAPNEGTSFWSPNQPSGSGNQPGDATAGRPSEKAQTLMKELEDLDNSPAQDPAGQAEQNSRRADILEQLAEETKDGADRALWLRQLADTVSAAVQTGGYPNGVARLEKLMEQLSGDKDKDLRAYVEFRRMTASYAKDLQGNVDTTKVQAKWLEDLAKYVHENPTSADSAEAMMQLGIAEEFAGDEPNALKWYNRVAENFPKTASGVKAEGAANRLKSVGKLMKMHGKTLEGKNVDLSKINRVTLVHYWSSEYEACRADLPQLEKLARKYEKQGFMIVSVSMDSDRAKLVEYLKGDPLPWPQIFEEGGLNSRLANEFGILTLPTMILVDKQGKVLNRSAHAAQLDSELKELFGTQSSKSNAASRPRESAK